MASKDRRATDMMNVSLSRISAAIALARQAAQEIPDGIPRRMLTRAMDQAMAGYEESFEHLQTISLHAKMI